MKISTVRAPRTPKSNHGGSELVTGPCAPTAVVAAAALASAAVVASVLGETRANAGPSTTLSPGQTCTAGERFHSKLFVFFCFVLHVTGSYTRTVKISIGAKKIKTLSFYSEIQGSNSSCNSAEKMKRFESSKT